MIYLSYYYDFELQGRVVSDRLFNLCWIRLDDLIKEPATSSWIVTHKYFVLSIYVHEYSHIESLLYDMKLEYTVYSVTAN